MARTPQPRLRTRAALVLLARLAALALLVPLAACRSEFDGGGELRARRAALEREVEGLRDTVARLERGEPLVPPGDVAVAIDDRMLRDMIVAQLPVEIDAERVHAKLTDAEVRFRGSPLVTLRGSGYLKEYPDLVAAVTVMGGLDDVEIEPRGGTLRGRIAVDHLAIERVAGLEALLSAAALDEIARNVRLEIGEQIPPIEIPVRVQQAVELPAVDSGPVRIAAATMPLEVGVSRVLAGQGRLWIGIRVRPGEVARAAGSAAEDRR